MGNIKDSPAESGSGPQAESYKGNVLGINLALGSLENPGSPPLRYRGCEGVHYATELRSASSNVVLVA
ncbi:hypothetical protein TNCV_2516241 [Trichonephila clavipes]|nr:hypothetical protein TNCV_2516241 [Trichonephila clavipes]